MLRLSLFALAVVCSVSFLVAADSETKKKKRPSPIVSPTIHDDGSVTLRVKANNAKEVFVEGEMVKKKVAMERDAEGVWSVTLAPVAPGLYGYSFNVDGLKMVDPGNMRLKPMRSPRTSILHIPGSSPFDVQDVPHGTIHYHGYHSKPINRFREMQVYTPPGYETNDQSYPLLVLQHGHSDSFATWTSYGRAHHILDNLIADGKSQPMIVLMLDGHPIPESYGDGRSPANTDELRRDMMEAAIPMVEELYRVRSGRENRAIAGLSMGGMHALSIGLNETNSFAWVGAFSSAIPDSDAMKAAMADAEKTNAQLNLLWIACGTQDFLRKENEKFIAALKQAGVKHQWVSTDGGHAWPIWRGYLADFAPLLFQ